MLKIKLKALYIHSNSNGKNKLANFIKYHNIYNRIMGHFAVKFFSKSDVELKYLIYGMKDICFLWKSYLNFPISHITNHKYFYFGIKKNKYQILSAKNLLYINKSLDKNSFLRVSSFCRNDSRYINKMLNEYRTLEIGSSIPAYQNQGLRKNQAKYNSQAKSQSRVKSQSMNINMALNLCKAKNSGAVLYSCIYAATRRILTYGGMDSILADTNLYPHYINNHINNYINNHGSIYHSNIKIKNTQLKTVLRQKLFVNNNVNCD